MAFTDAMRVLAEEPS